MPSRLAPRFAGLLLLLAAAGCSHPISKALRSQARKDLTFPIALQDPARHAGAIVIWGGVIIETLNRKDGTDITVLETPLSSLGEPADARATRGRFIAQTPRFLDPAVYEKGLKITLGGEITGKTTRPIGEIPYTYPIVSIKEHYLWEEEVLYPYYHPYYYPGWFGPYFGAGYYYGHHHHRR
jgi:outer membrane lipoprotein